MRIGKEPPIPLKPDSAKALSAWLTHQARGWHAVRYTPGLCDRWITLVYGDGTEVAAAVYSKAVIARRADGKGLTEKWFSSDEIAQLLSFFGTP